MSIKECKLSANRSVYRHLKTDSSFSSGPCELQPTSNTKEILLLTRWIHSLMNLIVCLKKATISNFLSHEFDCLTKKSYNLEFSDQARRYQYSMEQGHCSLGQMKCNNWFHDVNNILFYHLDYSDYCFHLPCYTFVSAEAPFSLLQGFHIELGIPHRT